MDTLIGKPYGLSSDEALKAHQVLTDSSAIKKTPYQLDLEVKDRKPSIIPKVGDRVKIKSLEWYEKWKDEDGSVRFASSMYKFANFMAEWCGKTLTVNSIETHDVRVRWRLNSTIYCFIPEMFEEVYPVQEQLSSEFPKIDLNSPYLHQSSYEVKGSELVLSKEELERFKGQLFSLCSERENELLKKPSSLASKVEETTKRLAAYSLVQGLTAKPKLKQVKTTHLIKLKKL